jgi:hypothetical protein
MFQLVIDDRFIPVLVCVLTVFLVLTYRPSILVNSASSSSPYSLNRWLVTLLVLAAGATSLAYLDNELSIPTLDLV